MESTTQKIEAAAREVRRLRSALKRERVILMVVTPQELGAIWVLLTPVERKRVTLLTSWPWDRPALASESLAAA